MDTNLRIIQSVARAEGVEASTIDEQLYQVINMDAVDSLFRDSPGVLRFQFKDYWITIDHTETITVEKIGQRDGSESVGPPER